MIFKGSYETSIKRSCQQIWRYVSGFFLLWKNL